MHILNKHAGDIHIKNLTYSFVEIMYSSVCYAYCERHYQC